MTYGQTPASATAALIREYAADALKNYGEEEVPAALLTAIMDSLGPEETCHLGRAMLARDDALADAPYRLGGEMCDPRKAEIATHLGIA